MVNTPTSTDSPPIARVRAILYTGTGAVLLIKRVRDGRAPYWVAPGGGIEPHDRDPVAALRRELDEELGATARIDAPAFAVSDGSTRQMFYVCYLLAQRDEQRHGPEFDDPARGTYTPNPVPLDRATIARTNIQPPALHAYLLERCEIVTQPV